MSRTHQKDPSTSLTLRFNTDEDLTLKKNLDKAAKKNRRSLQQEIMRRLERSLEQEKNAPTEGTDDTEENGTG